MTVTVNDILHTAKMDTAFILAGSRGINRKVCRIATIEKPYTDHPDYCNRVALPGDIYVSKCYAYQGNSNKLYEELLFMQRTGASGLMTYNEAMPLLEKNIIEAADKFGIPVILLDDNYGLTELIYNVTDLIIKDKLSTLHSASIIRILKDNPCEEDVLNTLKDIHPSMDEYLQIIFFRLNDSASINSFRINADDPILPVYGGYIYILSGSSKYELAEKQTRIIKLLRRFAPENNSGFGDIHLRKSELRQAILEALYAASYGSLIKKNMIKYDSLGMYAFLTIPENRPLLKHYRSVFESAINKCDKDNKLDLHNLTKLWILSGGDFTYVSKNMYISETTVRYRLNKLHDSLNLHNANDFYTGVKLAVYSEHILNDDLLKSIFS